MFGLGKTGQSTARALADAGHTVIAWDDTATSRQAFAKHVPNVTLQPVEDWPWHELDAFVLSPGVPLTHPAPHRSVLLAKEHHVSVTCDIELLCDAHPSARVIGITGTNGKSTTTTLIGHIFSECKKRVAVGGNLGVPVMDLPAMGAGEHYVLELSSYQLDLCQHTRVHCALLLNFSPDHLDRHGDMAGYIAAKKRIFAHQKPGDVAVVGVDDAHSKSVYEDLKKRSDITTLAISGKHAVEGGIYVINGVLYDARDAANVHEYSLREVKSLQGNHNYQNAAAAYAACVLEGLEPSAIIDAMQSFHGLAHRMQWLGEAGGVAYINDSKATNADAAEQALRTFEPIYWIAGGVAKDGGITALLPYFSKIAKAYLIGASANDFAHVLQQHHVPFDMAGTLDVAVKNASADARAASSKPAYVLLSPASASFDQYPNFEARGEHFMALVEEQKALVHANA